MAEGATVLAMASRCSRQRGTAKIKSAGDVHYDRCTQFRIIVVTDPQSHKLTNTQTNEKALGKSQTLRAGCIKAEPKNFSQTQTNAHRQDRLQYTAPQLARSVRKSYKLHINMAARHVVKQCTSIVHKSQKNKKKKMKLQRLSNENEDYAYFEKLFIYLFRTKGQNRPLTCP